jgi:DNA-binding MarR family transcriptional regulator
MGSRGKTSRSAPDAALAGELFAVVMGMMRSVAKEMRQPPQRLAPAQQAALAKLKHGAASMSELAGSLGVSVPTISKSIDVLEERCWVERCADPADRRHTMVRLTANGLRVTAAMRRRTERHVAGLLASLSEREREQVQTAVAILKQVVAPGVCEVDR